MSVLLLTILVAVIQGVPPLTDADRVQLDTAADFKPGIDEAALYPLLQNAAQWSASDQAGAMVPDYSAIFKSPADHRGQLFLIEGVFAGIPRAGSLKITRLTRPGPWDDRIEQWVIVTDQQQDQVAVVYLVDPPPAPRTGAKIRLAARFFKALSDTDQAGRPTDYLTFVGKTAVVQQPPPESGTTPGASLVVILLIFLVAAWVFLRRTIANKPLKTTRRRENAKRTPTEPGDEPVDNDLPEDPVEALSVLNERHKEDEKTD